MSEVKILTNEEIQAKADELGKALGCEVHPIVFFENDGTDQVIGFIKEPSRVIKYRVLDKSMTSPVFAANEMMEACLVKEHSDPRILSERPEHDKINIGATMAAFNLIKYSVDTFKKK